MLVSKMDDATLSKALERQTFTVELEEDWLTQMQQTVPISTRPGSYRVLLAKVPPGPALADVETAGPGLLDRVKTLVASTNNPDAILAMAHPQVVSEWPTLKEIFDPARYKAHALGKFIDLPGTRKVGASLYVLTSDSVEKFYFVLFSNVQGKLALRDVLGGAAMAELGLGQQKESAVQKLRDLFRDLNQNSETTAKTISSPKLYSDIGMIGGWKRLTRGQRLNPDQIQIRATVPLDQKSVRVVAHVAYQTPDRPMAFDVDFERFGNELLAVRLRDTKGKDIAVDTEMDCEVLKRYQVTGPCEYKPSYTDEASYLSIAKLQDYAERAMEDLRVADLSNYVTELETSFPTTETKGLPLGLRATVYFMNHDYTKAYEVGSSAIQAGGEVFFPLMHHTSGGLQKMILALSSQGLHYYPSYQSRRPEVKAPFSAIKKDGFRLDPGRKIPPTPPNPFLSVQLSLPNPEKGGKADDQTWNFMAPGSSCSAAGGRAGPGQMLWTQTAPCGAQLFGTTSTNGNVTLVPSDWDKALEAVIRIYEVSKSGRAAEPVRNRDNIR